MGKDLNVSWAWGEGGFSALEAKAGKLTDLKARLGNIMKVFFTPNPTPKQTKRGLKGNCNRWSEITGNREETCWCMY